MLKTSFFGGVETFQGLSVERFPLAFLDLLLPRPPGPTLPSGCSTLAKQTLWECKVLSRELAGVGVVFESKKKHQCHTEKGIVFMSRYFFPPEILNSSHKQLRQPITVVVQISIYPR